MRLAAILLPMLLRILLRILGPMPSPLLASTLSPPLAPRLSSLPASRLSSLLASRLSSLPASMLSLLPASRLSSLPASMLSSLPASMLSSLPASMLSSLLEPRLSSTLSWMLSWILGSMRRRPQKIKSRRRGPRPPRAERVAHPPGPDTSPCTQMHGREIWFRCARARTVRPMRVPPRIQADPVSWCRWLGPCIHKSGSAGMAHVCFAPKATALLRGSENDAMCHTRSHAPRQNRFHSIASSARASCGRRRSEPERFGGREVENRKRSVGNQLMPEWALLLPHAATALEIQLLVWAWTNDS